MPKSSILQVGDKVDITLDGKRFYKTTVGEVYQSGLVMIGAPIYRQTVLQLRLFDEVCMVYYRDSGRFLALMRVVDFLTKDGVRYSILEQTTESEKDQRREYYRLPTNSIETILCEYQDGLEMTLALRDEVYDAVVLAEARARDISATGIGIVTTRWECKLGDAYLLKLYFDGFSGKSAPMLVCARVMRSELTPESGIYNVGMQFFGLVKSKSEYLRKYILSQQQKRILQKKLIEGD